MAKRNFGTKAYVIAVLGILVLVNVLGLEVFGRLDMTKDGQFTLSEATLSTLAILEDPVTIQAYFTKDVPPPYSNNARYVKDLLDEYYNRGFGNLRYEFIDPLEAETQEEKDKKKNVQQDIFGRSVREATEVEKQLQTLGIPSVQLRVNEGDKLEVKRVYMGLAIRHGDQREVIPVVQRTESLEYDLTTLIKKMTRSRIPKIVFLEGHDTPNPQEEMSRLWGLLGQNYDLETRDLSTQDLGDEVDALVVAGPKTALSAAEIAKIDDFVMRGKAVAFLLDSVSVDFQSLRATPLVHGLSDLLQGYGVNLGQDLVLDEQCATINVSQQRGFMRIAQPVPYPFLPTTENYKAEHPLTRGLPAMAFPFSTVVSVVEGEGSEVVIQSSDKGWLQGLPPNLDPFQEWTYDSVGKQSHHGILATVTGSLQSALGHAEGSVATESSRIVVVGSSGFIRDQFMGEANEALALNLIDWLLLDEQLLAVRSRGLGAAPLDELTGATRTSIKYGNIAGLPGLFILLGLVRWRRRENRRKSASL